MCPSDIKINVTICSTEYIGHTWSFVTRLKNDMTLKMATFTYNFT